ncbi:resolvase domain-containing protein [Pseudomonas sp. CFII64]|uniref:recombinase family protein n=1 Tax=Pseudomonas sp. CFII64 TaxID=911242 RepID=UPI00035736EA|nr:recombinase family protein [Pseudomonas sp. CFII64]EPJ77215.1 resolvase domain-containing protein [Pseudomonas sp. CFII64]
MQNTAVDRSKPIAIAYVRWSSSIQSDGDSYDRQTSPLAEFTSLTGVPVVEIIIDPGRSAYTGENSKVGKLKDILVRIESGHIRKGDYLVVESIDRITRMRVLDGVSLIQDGILKKGVKLYTTSDNKVYSYEDPDRDLETLLMIGLIAKRANEESETKSKRRKSSWNKAKEKAENSGEIFNRHTPPYGLIFNHAENKFNIVEDEANEIRAIIEGLKSEGVSNTLKKVNINSKRKWTRRTVHQMLVSKYPTGALMSQRRENKQKVFDSFIENYYPQIVTNHAFQEAVNAMKQRGKVKDYGRTTEGSLNIFKHCIKCGLCGATLMFEKSVNQKGVKYGYLHCHTSKETLSTCETRFRFDLAFGTLLQLVRQITGEDIDYTVHEWANREPIGNTGTYLENEQDSENLNDALLDFFSNSKLDQSVSVELIEKEKLLANAKSLYENLTASLSNYADGKIPKIFIDKVIIAEEAVSVLSSEVDELAGELHKERTDIDIYSSSDILSLYDDESGRLKLNTFFKENKFEFVFTCDRKTRTVFMTLRDKSKDIQLARVGKRFTLHHPLKEFGINSLSEYMNAEI